MHGGLGDQVVLGVVVEVELGVISGWLEGHGAVSKLLGSSHGISYTTLGSEWRFI